MIVAHFKEREGTGMKLMVKYGKSKKYPPFHPALRLRRDGYCPAGHWQQLHFEEGLFCGGPTIYECPTVAEAVAEYFKELRRMNYVEVKDGE
jgi:hypothetical protein